MSLKNSIYLEKSIRQRLGIKEADLNGEGRMVIPDVKTSRFFVSDINQVLKPEKAISASDLYLASLLNQLSQELIEYYFHKHNKISHDEKVNLSGITAFKPLQEWDTYLTSLSICFPYIISAINESEPLKTLRKQNKLSNRIMDGILLYLINKNPACSQLIFLFPDKNLSPPVRDTILEDLDNYINQSGMRETGEFNLVMMLLEPAKRYPHSLEKQIQHILEHWGVFLPLDIRTLLTALDFFKEEHACRFNGPGEVERIDFSYMDKDYAHFSQDSDWMPNIILLAKNAFVWLDQLTKKYSRPIVNLMDIPDEELDELAGRGITGLWLIGLWERSRASKSIKRICGNPEAEASAYSLNKYDIAEVLGGWAALENLKERCLQRGIRMASDMVPNHTGLDSDWVIEHPDYFLSRPDIPFPGYTFNGPNLSQDDRISLFLEDGYYTRSDAAVVFKRVENATEEALYMYHGNDGTTMPWNDTAQLNFLEPHVREEIIQQILHVAHHFPIIRFDAAMTLARKHIQRLWFPAPGKGGAIPSRSEYAMSDSELQKKIPTEFWREVVDRMAQELPETLLLAEAFWMMEGYFVRNLGMHRVYNSAFMNLLKTEDNREYRRLLKETLDYDPKILKRYVNFMNNPDEDTAVAQFGKGDKYFGVCTLMMTLPGLPMIGHGQFEGYEEKYGMEYKKAYKDETPDKDLLDRHYREIVPLMKIRILFAGAKQFHFFDYIDGYNHVNDNVYAFTNSREGKHALVLYNNSMNRTEGWINWEVPKAVNNPSGDRIGTNSDHLQGILGLKENEFTTLYDTKEMLWYIHRNSDLIKEGLPVSLNGYQSRVYFPIIQRTDDEKRSLEKLKIRIGQNGIPDLERAIKYYELEPMIHMLHQFFQNFMIETPEMSDRITELSKNLHKIQRIMVHLEKKTSNRQIVQDQKNMEAIIIPAVQALQMTNLKDDLLFQMAQFFEFLGEWEKKENPWDFKGLLLHLFNNQEYFEWFGINEHDGILWYNQEKMEESLWWFSIITAVNFLETDPEHAEKWKEYEQFLSVLQNALAESGYQIQKVIDHLQ